MINIAIADDQELVRSGIRMILEDEPDMQVAGEAAEGQQAFELVQQVPVDVLLMDVRMPGCPARERPARGIAHQGGATAITQCDHPIVAADSERCRLRALTGSTLVAALGTPIIPFCGVSGTGHLTRFCSINEIG